MTSREARRHRREQERKAKKVARKAALNPRAPEPTLEDEFSPEFLAHAGAVRERIEQRAGLEPGRAMSFSGSAPPSLPEPPPALAAHPKPDRAAINRANATQSTGPVTPAGKLASSRNSLKHGLASGQLIMSGEDPAEFEALLNDLLNDHQPANITEEMLIKEMAQSWWLAQRALRLQNDCFTFDGVDEKRLALFLRYQTSHERAFHRALNTLIRLQKHRRHQNRPGFVSQKQASAAPHPGFVSQHRTESLHPSPGPLVEVPEKEVPSSQAA